MSWASATARQWPARVWWRKSAAASRSSRCERTRMRCRSWRVVDAADMWIAAPAVHKVRHLGIAERA